MTLGKVEFCTNFLHFLTCHNVTSPRVNPSGLPWELRLGACLLWGVIMAALAVVLQSGLSGLQLPGLGTIPRLLWLLAVALTVADSVLLLAWHRWKAWPLLAAVGLVFGLTLSLEAVNVANGLKAHHAGPIEARALAEQSERLRVDAADRRGGAETRLFQIRASRATWTKDGDSANDGQEEAAAKALEEALSVEAEASTTAKNAQAAVAVAEGTSSMITTLPHLGLWILAGLAALKLVALALAALVHSSPAEPEKPSPLPPEKTSMSESEAVQFLPPLPIPSRKGPIRPPEKRKRQTIVGASLGRLADRFMR